MKFKKGMAGLLIMALVMSALPWSEERVSAEEAEEIVAEENTVSENSLPEQEEVKEVQPRAPIDIIDTPNENEGNGESKTILDNGTDGGISWVVYDDGELVVSGTGDRANTLTAAWPWDSYEDNIVSVSVQNTGMTNASNMFSGCSNLSEIDLSGFDTSSVTSMHSMFRDCSNLSSLDLSTFQTMNVTDMSEMFSGCSSLSNLDLSRFDTAKVTDMGWMFHNCSNLSNLDLSRFDTAKVTDMGWMFYGCKNLSNLDLNSFDTAEVTNMSGMFWECSNLSSLDLNTFDTAKVTDMSTMFRDCSNLNNLDLSTFSTAEATNMCDMFAGCSNLNILDLNTFDTAKVTNMGFMFSRCSNLSNLDLNMFDTSSVTYMRCMFDSCINLNTLDLSTFNTVNVTDMSDMFSSCNNLTSLILNSFNTENVEDMESMFYNCSKLTSLDLSSFDASKLTSAGSMFGNCSGLNTIQCPRNISLPINTPLDAVWCLPDGTEIVELPQNQSDSVTITRKNDYIASGVDGGITWFIDQNGKLTVSGSGDCTNRWPWSQYSDLITSAEIHVTGMTNSSNMFSGFDNLSSLDVSGFDTANVTNMSHMFDGCSKLSNLDVSGFDTTNVTNMSSMFVSCSNLGNLDVSGFNTSNVTNVDHMFSGCSKLSNLDVSGFDTSNVIYMGWMFDGCSKLSNLDISRFDTTNVTHMGYMFNGCSNLGNLDVSGFDTANVTNMYHMFAGCNNLSNLDMGGFDTSNVMNMYHMFDGCSTLSNLDVSGFDTSNVNGMGWMFSGCSKLSNLNVSGFDTSNVTDMDFMFSGCGNLGNLDLRTFDASKLTYAQGMFDGCSGLNTIQCPRNISLSIQTPLGAIWSLPDGTEVTELPQNQSDSVTITRKNDYIASGIDGGIIWFIDQNGKLTVSGSGDCTNRWPWSQYSDLITSAEVHVTGMTNSSNMFSGFDNLNSLDVSGFDTINVTDMSYMFFGCSKLSDLDVIGFDTTNVTNMSYMFYDCNNLSNLNVSTFDTANVTDMNSMFRGCSTLTNLDASGFDTSNVIDMYSMFSGCNTLSNLDVSGFDTSNVIDMYSMFSGCSNLSNLDVGGFDTSNVITMCSMFSGCSNLSEIDVSGFDTANVTNMGGMFLGCSNLSEIDVSGFDTTNVIDIYSMFNGCSNLSNLDLSTFNTTNVTNMSGMFSGCNNLCNLDVSGFNTVNVTAMYSMFFDCSSLEKLDISSFDASKVTNMGRMLYGCNQLSTIYTPYNLRISAELPSSDIPWHLEDGTEITELPQNLDHSVKIIREIKPTPDNPTDDNDQWLQVTAAAGYDSNTYKARNDGQSVLDTLFDAIYNNAYQTLFINKEDADLSRLAPIFSIGGSIKAYVQDSEQSSGESTQDFSHGPVAYSARSADESRDYWITFAKKENGSKLFVNGPAKREIYLTDYFNNRHDILVANTGNEVLSGIKVELLDASHIKLDDTISVGTGDRDTLSAFTRIPSSGEGADVMTNLGKIRLIPDGEGEIGGTLLISADGQAPIQIALTGYSSNPKIITTTTDLNMEDVVRVKYVPYSYTVETNNIDTENTVTFSLEEGRLAEGLMIYPATGEIYGVPLETGEFPIKVKATYSRPEFLPSYADLTLTVKDNTDGNVYNASDYGYELKRAVGKETSSGSNDFVLTRKGNQLFVSAGPYHEFIDFWLNGQRLVDGEDYTKESGSTRITIRSQTFTNKANTEGTNTFAAEFRTAGDSSNNLRRTAQNFRIQFKHGSGSKSRSHSEEENVAAGSAVSSNVSFAMRLVNPAGIPLSGLTVEVHSTPKISQTNQNGMASFYDVESGAHTLLVKDQNGNLLASTNFEILFGDSARLQDMQLTVRSGSRFTVDTQLDGDVLTFVNLQEGDVYRILSADTADDTDIAVWFALLLVSCGMGVGIYRCNRRRKAV